VEKQFLRSSLWADNGMIVALVENKLQRSINDYNQNNSYRVKITNEAAKVQVCW